MGVKTVDLVQHIVDIYGKIMELDLKKNQKIFDEALDTTIPIEKYFWWIDDCIKYTHDGKHPYTAAQIINNAYNTILATNLYTEPKKMRHKNLSSDNTWDGFKNLFAEEYHDLRKQQRINGNQKGFHGGKMAITIQYKISKAL